MFVKAIPILLNFFIWINEFIAIPYSIASPTPNLGGRHSNNVLPTLVTLILFSLPLLNTKLSMYYSWWSNLDYIFLIISFFMVYFSVQTTRIKRMKLFFWLSWFFLFLVVINEKTELFEFSEYLAYLATTGLSLLHLFNLKYCK